ncbi:hypothetical protein RT42_GL000281 [Enterococcus cecorum DSM 20682 = ATCC 43198]|nr:hypothetical protein RT42_GL000281 [Enterococcus cecorum DSM 20682 = ATCC 43198]
MQDFAKRIKIWVNKGKVLYRRSNLNDWKKDSSKLNGAFV